MSKIFLGNISVNSEKILKKYLDKFMPDAVIEPLKAAGIKNKIKNHARRPDVALVIIDTNLYDMCVGVADDVLALPKVHKYTGDAGFIEFLKEKFGTLDDDFIEDKSSVDDSYYNSKQVEEVDENDLDNLEVTTTSIIKNDSDKDNRIQKLNDELIVKDTIIRNLEAQLEEKSQGRDISHFIAKIKTLEAELKSAKEELSRNENDSYTDLGKVARAEQIISKVDTLTEELSKEKENVSNLRLENEKLMSSLSTKTNECSDLESTIDDLESKVVSLSNDLSNKTDEVNELVSKSSELTNKVTELNAKLAQISVLNEELEKQRGKNSSLVSENSSLKNNISELEDRISNLSKDLEDLVSKNSLLVDESDSLKNKVTELESKLSIASNEVSELNNKISSLDSLNESKVSELELVIASKGEEIDRLKSELNNANAKCSSLEEDISRLSENSSVITELRSKISELQLKSSDDTIKISDLTSQIVSLNKDITESKSKIGTLTSDLSNSNSKVVSLTEDLEKSRGIIDSLTSRLNSQNLSSSELDSIKKKNSELEDKLSDLDLELLEYKKKVASYESENSSLKDEISNLKENSSSIDDCKRLKSEISTYRIKVKELKSENRKQANYIDELRGKCAELETSLVEQEESNENSLSSIFGMMQNIASPKTVFNAFIELNSSFDNMFVFASGSAESNICVYEAIRRYCSSVNSSIVIFDIVTDSYIDGVFGVEKIISPIDFLKGNCTVDRFLSNSELENVKIVSTAFSYINSLYFLTVDWDNVLSNLSNVADIVIINVGCLNDSVSKILFNTFSAVMNSHIIIKATPINLRTALLSLAGMPSAKNSIVSCMNFDNTSKAMYQRLAQKFNTQILRDSSVLQL